MTYDEFWNRDYRLVESYKKKNEMDIEEKGQSLFVMYSYIARIYANHCWQNSDKKKRGKEPKLPEKYEPQTAKGKRNAEIEKEKIRAVNEYRAIQREKRHQEKEKNVLE